MNYDQIGYMKVKELRLTMEGLLNEYNTLTHSRVSVKELKRMAKSRVVYMLCRYWAEVDVKTKYKRMYEELHHREVILRKQAVADEITRARRPRRKYIVTVEEAI